MITGTTTSGVSLLTSRPFGYTIDTTDTTRRPSSTYALGALGLTSVIFGGCFKASPITNPHEAQVISREECVAMNAHNSQISAGTGIGLGLVAGLLLREIFRGGKFLIGKAIGLLQRNNSEGVNK